MYSQKAVYKQGESTLIMREENFMKIAMIGHKRIPSREGGVEIVVEQLAERMVAQGHEVYAYNRKGHHVSGEKRCRYGRHLACDPRAKACAV